MSQLPTNRPFLGSASGLHRRQLSRLTATGELRRLLQGVYVAYDVPDTLGLRAQALALVVPPGGVVVDRTAAWLHGIDLLLPDELVTVPPIQVFHTGRGRWVGQANCSSGQRMMPPSDWEPVDGLRVTTPLRTALDLGRLGNRDRAFVALDAFLRHGVDHEVLLGQIDRFKGYRGVRQLRFLAPFADARAESGAESVTRLRWILTTTTPWPEPQVLVLGPGGVPWRLDLGAIELYFAVEYDSVEFHSTPEQQEHDAWRRAWIAENTPWHVEVVRKHNIYGPQQDFTFKLPGMLADARRTLGERVTRGKWTRSA